VRADWDPKGEADRSARRGRARAELEAVDREEATAHAERDRARARLAQHRAALDELGSYVLDQQRRQVDEEIRAREKGQRMMQELRDVVNAPIPRTRQQCEQVLAQLDPEAAQREQAEQVRLWRETDAALTRRIYEPAFRRSWDARHPGGPDRCPCDGCRAWRREPPR
jgi:hypothetical protein